MIITITLQTGFFKIVTSYFTIKTELNDNTNDSNNNSEDDSDNHYYCQ